MAQTAGTGHEHDAAIDREVARLYELYADRIFGYCLYRLGNRTEAEDAVQTTFLYVFRGLQRGVVPEVESSWLFTIAHNVCRSTRRSVRRRRRVESQQDPQLLQELAPGIETDNDTLVGLEDALASIPEKQRQAILLREWQGMPYREIAAALGLTQTAVEMLVFRARRSLADALTSGRKPAERRRVARALNFANLISAAKSFIGGFSAAQVAAAASAVVVASAAGGDAAQPELHHVPQAPPRSGAAVGLPSGDSAELAPLVVRHAQPAARRQTPSEVTAHAGGTPPSTAGAAVNSTAPVASDPAKTESAPPPTKPAPAVRVPSPPSAQVSVPAVPVVTPTVPAPQTAPLPDVDIPSVQQTVDTVETTASSVSGVHLP